MAATIEHERLEAERLKTGSFINIFYGTNGWRTLIACWPKCCQQLTGVSSALYSLRIAPLTALVHVHSALARQQLRHLLLPGGLPRNPVSRRALC